jgi:hypothetical protein
MAAGAGFAVGTAVAGTFVGGTAVGGTAVGGTLVGGTAVGVGAGVQLAITMLNRSTITITLVTLDLTVNPPSCDKLSSEHAPHLAFSDLR